MILANSIQVLVSLIISIALARYFIDKSIYGKYQQIYIVINFAVAFTSGIPLGLSYFYSRYEKFSSRIRTAKRFFGTLSFIALLLCIGIYFLKDLFAIKFSNDFFIEYFILFIGILFLKVTTPFFLNFYLLRNNVKYYLKVVSISAFLTISFLGATYYFSLDVKTILLAMLIIELTKYMLLLIRSRFIFFISGSFIVSRNELKHFIPLTATAFLSTVSIYVDKIMISYLLTPPKYAEYQVGAFSIPFIGIITGSIVTALIPTLSRLHAQRKHESIIQEIKSATKTTTLFLLPILIYSIILGNYLILLLYSDLYDTSGKIFQYYTSIYLFSVIAFSAVLNSIGLHRWIVINSLINLISNIVFNVILIPKFGPIGAVYATIASTYLGYIFPIYLIKKHLNAKPQDYFPIKMYIKVLIFSLIFSYMVYLTLMGLALPNIFVIFLAIPYYLTVLGINSKREDILSHYLKIKSKIQKWK